jgi:hypothetical protein
MENNTSEQKYDYMLLFRGTNWDRDLSPQELQRVVSDWVAWFEGLSREGKCLGGHPLVSEGKLVSGKKGRTVADGPFAESKEAIAGYFYLRVSGMEEALAIARQCPALEHGAEVEVRPVADVCAVRQRAMLELPKIGKLAEAAA